MTRTAVSAPKSDVRQAVDVSALVLRSVLAFVFVAHGSQKLFGAFGGGGIAGTAAFFSSLGAQPGLFWAVVVGLVEFVGGIALALGFSSRAAAALLAIDMIVAIIAYNAGNGFFVETPKGGWEINLVLLAMCVSIMITGSGRFSADALIGPVVSRRSVALSRLF
jgi:putative oxidoreductase